MFSVQAINVASIVNSIMFISVTDEGLTKVEFAVVASHGGDDGPLSHGNNIPLNPNGVGSLLTK